MASNQTGETMQSGGGEAPPGFKFPPGSPPYPADGPPPFPPGGAPPQIPGQQPIIPVPVLVGGSLGYRSVLVTCGGCGQPVATRTEASPSLIAWISCGMICILCGFLGCCLIPFCISPCYDVEHSCPNCGAHLGRTGALSN